MNDLNRNLTAEVVSIGDEMTSGARLDTNAQWLSRRLGELGVVVTHHSTVADTLQDNIDVFRIAAGRVDLVVSTGGLGPTRDDLTREALAAASGTELEFSPSALSHIEALFARRNREMPERNRVQAMFPVGSREVFNPQGTAPGIDIDIRSGDHVCRIFALPGVPAEMKRMFDDTVEGRILEQAGGASQVRHLVMKFFGVGESDMEHRLGEMIARDRQPRVGITVSAATISLRITATGNSQDRCEAMIAETRKEILERVGDLHFGDGEEFEQQHAIDARLREKNQSMMLIELGHAAPLGDWFAVLGETPSFRGGLSLANLEDLWRLAGNASQDADNSTGTGHEADVDGCFATLRERFRADWILLVDQYPSLDCDDDHPHPASEIKLTVVDPEGRVYATKTMMGGHPAILQARIGKAAMAWFRKVLK